MLYDDIRGELIKLAALVEAAALRFDPVYGQLIQAEVGRPLSGKEWMAFIHANRDREKDGEWEQWDVFPDLEACLRVYGLGDLRGLEEFRRLAGSAMEAVRELSELVAADQAPAGTHFDLPPNVPVRRWNRSNFHFDWLQLIYDTGLWHPTMLLDVHVGNWRDRPVRVLDEIADAERLEKLLDERGTTPDGVTYPLHPVALSLQHDLFRSSAEAIRVWLGDGQAVRIKNRNGKAPLCIPGAADPSQQAEAAWSPAVPGAQKPRWDESLRELRIGDVRLKRYAQTAKSQFPVLRKFEDEGWPNTIQKPMLPSLPYTPYKKQLNSTISDLNKGLDEKGIVRFRIDGTGEGVIWEFVSDTTP